MASEVLSSRSDQHWSEQNKVYRRKYTSNYTNDNPNSTPHFTRFNHSSRNPNPSPGALTVREVDHFSCRGRGVVDDNNDLHRPIRSASSALADDSTFKCREPTKLDESCKSRVIRFRISSYTKREMRELKTRLISDLSRIRSLRSRIGIRERNVASHFSGRSERSGFPPPPQPPPQPQRSSIQPENAIRSPVTPVFPGGTVAAVSVEERDSHLSRRRRIFPSLAPPPPPMLPLPPLPRSSNQPENAFRSPVTPVFSGGTVANVSLEEKGTTSSPPKGQNLSKKRAMPPLSGKVAKRPANGKHSALAMKRKLGGMLTKLLNHKHGWVFKSPVDPVELGVPDYHKIIPHPMDLGTIKTKLGNNEYESPAAFASDVKLTFTNAMIYNGQGSSVYDMARILLDIFEVDYKKFDGELHRNVGPQQLNPHQTMSELQVLDDNPRREVVWVSKRSNSAPQLPASPCPPATKPAEKMRKPKARDPNKRAMTFDEKTQLATSLTKLPQGPDGIGQIMPILKRRFPGFGHEEEEEVEIDVDAFDNETLWELDRVVARYDKKVAAAAKINMVFNNMASALPVINQYSESELDQEQTGEKGDVDEEDVDIGEEIPASNFPCVEIERDVINDGGSSRSSSSSSSSSSSDSSSTDSDSGSSSGCDSDAAGAVHSPANGGELISPMSI